MKQTIIEPRTLPGFMELLPEEQILFNQMLETIKNTYESFGFSPIDTPIIELSEVLLAKAGGDTEKQIYRMSKGDHDLTMRYDLTVPLAKYVAKNVQNLKFPFRRYQIGKVFRGERPQSGRFREFYQCDVDIIGDGALSIQNDAEIPAIIYHTFKNLGFQDFKIFMNNRKILTGLCEHLEVLDRATEVLRCMDKILKIGQEKVEKELLELQISQETIHQLLEVLSRKGTPSEILSFLENMPITNETFQTGLQELKAVTLLLPKLGVPMQNFCVDLSIARGLDYYTGTIYETILDEYPSLGSVCSGGRYDNLAEHYTKRQLPGVGISIGLTRLFYQLMKVGFLKAKTLTVSDVMLLPFETDSSYAMSVATTLRKHGIKTTVFLEEKSFKQKLNHANKIGIAFVGFLGEDEQKEGRITLKQMDTGEQRTCTLEEAIHWMQNM